MYHSGSALGGVLIAAIVAVAGASACAPEPSLRAPAASARAPAGDWGRGQQLFTEACAGCHTIGGGPRQGPDLKGVTERRTSEWLGVFLRDPERVTHGDPIGQQLLRDADGDQMPPQNLSVEDVRDLLSYLADPDGAVLSHCDRVPRDPPISVSNHTGESG